MPKYFFNFLLISISLFVFSCSKNKETKLRIVDLQGKPHNIKTRTPELNAQFLQSQAMQQNQAFTTDSANSTNYMMPDNANAAVANVNNYSQNQANVAQPQNKYANADYDEASKNVVEKTLQTPVNSSSVNQNSVSPNQANSNAIIAANTPQNIAQNGEAKILATIGQKQESEVEEVSLNESPKTENLAKKSAIKKSAKLAKKSSKKVANAGYFVQVGAFSSEFNAENSLAEMKKFSDGKVEEAEAGDKKIYRALLGPFSDKNKALNLMNEIKNSGHDAVIVKRK